MDIFKRRVKDNLPFFIVEQDFIQCVDKKESFIFVENFPVFQHQNMSNTALYIIFTEFFIEAQR